MGGATQNVMHAVRDLMPARAISLGQAYLVGEQQATLLPKLLGVTHVPVDVSRVGRLPRMALGMKSRDEMDGQNGKSQWRNGKWEIDVCRDDPLAVRRFTLAREVKRVLDATMLRVVYAGLHCENAAHYQHRIESICDHFAACLLMPRLAVRRVWTSGLNDVDCLAELFRVPTAVMVRRLVHLGLVESIRPLVGLPTGSGPILAAV